MKKRILSIALTLCMLLSLVPLTPIAVAATTDTTTSAKDITLGTSAIQDPAEVTTDSGKYYTPNSYIYFGKNGETPIKWRVLDADKTNDGTTAGMFLLSEYVLATDVQFDAGYNNNYQGSDAKTWCSNFAANSSNFSTTEQNAMQGVAKTDSTENLYSISWGESSLTIADKAFFLSARELADYVGNYDGAPGLAVTDAAQASAWWWLRSPIADDTIDAGVVNYDGVVYYDYVVFYIGVRPALNLNLSSVLFTSAAVGGVAENKNLSAITGNDGYKLTLLDTNRAQFKAELKSLSGNTATVSYDNATPGANEYISVIIKNGSTVKYYGRVANVSDASAASGDVDITLPSDYSIANGDVLCVFNEQYNGDKMTDYASKLIDVMPFDYTVNFNANGATGTMASQTMTYGIASSLSANTFTRNGYTFNGWNTKADGNGTAYTDGQSVTNLVPDASTPSVTLYAQWKDTASPVFSGIENGKTYCLEVKFKVTDNEGISSVEFDSNGKTTTLTADEDGYYTIKPETGSGVVLGTVIAGDTSNNKAYCSIFVKEYHVIIWKNDGANYWQECDNCHKTGDKKPIPSISIDINGADKACRMSEYVFSFEIPYGCKDPSGYIDLNGRSAEKDPVCTVEGNVATITSPADVYGDAESFDAVAIISLEDGYPIEASKTVFIQNEHTGGTATCTDKAVCEVCGEEYGESDAANHATLNHTEAKAATVTETGNTEYWYCKDCDKYFSEKDGKNEIDLKDTVTPKLPPEIIDGKGQTLTEGEKKELTFRSNAAFGDFIRVEVDGKTVDPENYTVKEGSTVVTLNPGYVATLSVGEHTLGIVSQSGTATTTFTVYARALDATSPQTGDNSHMALMITLLFASGGALVGTAAFGKKRKYSAK